MSLVYWLPALVGFLVAIFAPFVLKPLLTRSALLDIPNERSSHDKPALRGGGIAQTAGIAIGLLLALTLAKPADRPWLAAVTAAATASAALGWIEDFRGVKITVRAATQFFIGAIVTGALAVHLGHSILWGILGGIALIGLINVVNFMDGVNEISAFHGIVAGVSFIVLGHLNDVSWIIVAGAILASTFAAFMPWNFNGSIFLGDVGSYLLGGTIGIIIVLGWMQGIAISALAAPMSIYVADTGITLIGRVVTGQKWYEAHRDHTYQRMNRRGLSHIEVASIVASASGLTAATGIAAAENVGWHRMILILIGFLVVILYTASRFVFGASNNLVSHAKGVL